METLEFNGKRYIKISSAARETGYTADYIGQLCRGKKIDAKLVGRTWYVYEDELHMHQRTRGRSSHEKARKSVKEQVRAATEQEVIIPIHHASERRAPEYRKRIINEKIQYHADDSNLFPKTALKHLSFDAGSAVDEDLSSEKTTEHKLKIDKDDDVRPVAFTKTEKPEIKWNGTIVIKPLEEEGGESSQSSDTAPGTVRLAVHEEDARLTHPTITGREEIHDPLAIKERFLTRLNQAHDLNTDDTAEEVASNTTAAYRKPRDTQNRTKITHHSVAIRKKSYSWGFGAMAMLSFLAFYILPTLFLENTISYSQGTSSTKTPPVMISKYGLTLPNALDTNAGNIISSIRDIL